MATRFFPNYKENLITSRFGQRVHPLTKIKTMHNGIDMTATNDGVVGNTDSITAHTGGTVEKVGYDWSAGNYIKIRVDNRTVMVYYHMREKSTLKAGDTVKKGDRLGYVGKTGTAAGAHLHFGIQYDGKWIDPEPYLDQDWVQPFQMVSIQVPVLQYLSNGESVKALQSLLNLRLADSEDLPPLDTDGSFGPATKKALGIYQDKTDGLTKDYCCGPATWSRLISG